MCSGYPLSKCLSGHKEPDADLVIWMAQQYPAAVYHKPMHGLTVLHRVCGSLAMMENEFEYAPIQCTPNMAKICRFLISEHPRLVEEQIHNGGYLPIHMLAGHCNRPIVQEIAILLLKAYPDCVQVKAGRLHPKLSMVPFIQQVLPLAEQELKIDLVMRRLVQASQDMASTAALSTTGKPPRSTPKGAAMRSSLFGSVAGVFCSWSNLQTSVVLPASKQRIQERIAQVCVAHVGDDPDEEEQEAEFWNEDRGSDNESNFDERDEDDSEEEDDDDEMDDDSEDEEEDDDE